MKKALTLSLIIPVYNEEDYMEACLKSIAHQTRSPLEVIVVDNNSTDKSMEIARKYRFVKIVRETRQGCSFAVLKGFSVAKGDILGRIDAENILAEDWVEQAVWALQNKQWGAVVGQSTFWNVGFPRLFRSAHWFFYHCLQRMLAGTQILWGTNMAISRTAWKEIARYCEDLPLVDEDICMSLFLRRKRIGVKYVPMMKIQTAVRQGDDTPRELFAYMKTWPKNYTVCGRRLTAPAIWVLTCFVFAVAVAAMPFRRWLIRKV